MTRGWVIQGFLSSDFTLSENAGTQKGEHQICSSMCSLSNYLISTFLDTRVSIESNKRTKVHTIIAFIVQGIRERH